MNKKVYVKPSIYVECFELAQHIANCVFELNIQKNACAFVADSDWEFPGLVVFNDDIMACEYPGDDIVCEFNGSDLPNTFDS